LAEDEKDMGDATMGNHARLMSQAMRKINPKLGRNPTDSWEGTALVFTNQIRMKIGVMFGNPETTTGGQAMKFYASMRFDVRRISQIKDGQELRGSRTRVRVVKNKLAPPFKESEFDIMYNEGISRVGDLVDIGSQLEIIDKRGAFFSFKEQRIGQGRENAKQFLKDNPTVADEIEAAIRASKTVVARTSENTSEE
jgi:recombination protein RecA